MAKKVRLEAAVASLGYSRLTPGARGFERPGVDGRSTGYQKFARNPSVK